MNYLQLTTLLMAELLRRKKSGLSLTKPTIERAARYRFADAVGINRRSSADVYITEIGRVLSENGYADRFNDLVKKLG
jgi:hypothetical protein